jgi:anti-sigma B factor antagonist
MPTSSLPFDLSVAGLARFVAQAPPYRFSCSRRAESGGLVRLLLAGELDLAAVPRFRKVLGDIQDDSGRVLLDLKALTLIDCAGLSVIFTAAERARNERAVLILHGPRGQVRRMLDLVGAPVDVTVTDDADLPDTGTMVAA